MHINVILKLHCNETYDKRQCLPSPLPTPIRHACTHTPIRRARTHARNMASIDRSDRWAMRATLLGFACDHAPQRRHMGSATTTAARHHLRSAHSKCCLCSAGSASASICVISDNVMQIAGRADGGVGVCWVVCSLTHINTFRWPKLYSSDNMVAHSMQNRGEPERERERDC